MSEFSLAENVANTLSLTAGISTHVPLHAYRFILCRKSSNSGENIASIVCVALR